MLFFIKLIFELITINKKKIVKLKNKFLYFINVQIKIIFNFNLIQFP